MEGWSPRNQWALGDINCTHGLREFNEHTQKQVYTIGVHAPAGVEKAMNEYNLTFETYLTEVVGKRFDPPIEFQMKATEWPLLSWIDLAEEVDFMYSDTGLYSCIGTEIGAQPLATTIASLDSRGNHYELDVYGGEFTLINFLLSDTTLTFDHPFPSNCIISPRHDIGAGKQREYQHYRGSQGKEDCWPGILSLRGRTVADVCHAQSWP